MNILLHTILKLLYLITARTYYSKITILNLEKVPVNEPLLIAINHSNAFWDGVLIGLHTKQRVWFLARGDVFKKPLAAKILNAIGIAPIYRMQEGIENIEKNKEVFNRCYQLLGKNQSIAIFPEGNCERESKLRPLKKGTARIAHGALESFKTNKSLYITCAGINYDDPDTLNSEVLVNFGKALKVNDYFDAMLPLDSKSALQLTKDVATELDKVMYNIHATENHALFHFIKRNFASLLLGRNKNTQFEFEQFKTLSEKINENEVAVTTLKKSVTPYMKSLNVHNLREKYVNSYLIQSKYITDYVVFLMLLIPSIPALLFNSWPYFLAYHKAKKTVKKKEFFSSVNIGLAGLLYFVWYIALFIMFIFFLPLIKAFALVVTLHFSGIIALHLMSYYRTLSAYSRMNKLTKIEKETLIAAREQCVEAIQKFVQP